MVKTEEEIKSLKKAVEITDELYLKIKEFVVAGKTEKEVYDYILKIIDESEADKYSFEPIVAAGANGAEPHHKANDYIIQEGDLVVIDFGVFYEGLASDMTRMIAVGEISEEQ
jgi:Xaa-Pro aminopeptidase